MTTTETKNANNKKTNLPALSASYLAGLLDADGSIYVQIVPKPKYNCLFGLQFTISYSQSLKRKHCMIEVKNLIGPKAYIRDRNDGMCEVSLYGRQSVVWFLSEIRPYLRFKKLQADLVFKIVENLPHTKTYLKSFIEVCSLVDKIAEYNDSKKRKYSAEYVKNFYKENGINFDELVPVETF